MVPRAERFLRKHLKHAVGVTATSTGSYPQFSRKGMHPNPMSRISEEQALVPATIRDALGIRIIDDQIIVWTRDQSRFIEYLAKYEFHSGIYKKEWKDTNKKYKKHQYNKFHFSTMRRFAKNIGVGVNEMRALWNFSPFWMAINDRKKEILGLERFWEVAQAIFDSAIDGSYSDRKLYLEVFTNHLNGSKKKPEEDSEETFERRFHPDKKKKKKKKKRYPIDLEDSKGIFRLKSQNRWGLKGKDADKFV